MVSIKAEQRSSLDRLKSLNTLPDLHQQLDEAIQLRTHAARADMIVKWMLEKLKTDQEARSDSRLWRELTSTLRLLPAERIGILLGSIDLLEIICSCLAIKHGLMSRMSSLTNFLAFLSAILAGPDAALIKSALSIDGSKAAKFVGAWLQAVILIQSRENSPENQLDEPACINLPMQVWDIRKPETDEDETFAEFCLVPMCLLLVKFSRSKVSPFNDRLKRTHDRTEPVSSGVPKIEYLLAKHIILPSRKAFLQAQDAGERAGSRQVGAQDPCFILDKMMKPLKDASNKQKLCVDHAVSCLPLLLDLALRCAPARSPRQQMRERPWIESLWKELLMIHQAAPSDHLQQITLIDMLTVIQAKASLSQGTLEMIVRRFAKLDTDDSVKPNWILIAMIVKIDPHVLTDQHMVQLLFSAMTHAATHTTTMESELAYNENQEFWRNQILAPVINAFANSRDLATFVELWKQQLIRQEQPAGATVWTDLDVVFAPLVQRALTDSQIVSLFNSLYDPLHDVILVEDEGTSRTRLYANASIICALLDGIESELVLDILIDKLGTLLEILLSSHFVRVYGIHEPRSWTLLTKLFEHWFPRWASNLSDMSAIIAKGKDLFSSGGMKEAVKLSDMEPVDNVSIKKCHSISEVNCFIASVIHSFHQYDDLLNICQEIATKLARQSYLRDVSPIHRYPALIALLSKEVRAGLLYKYIEMAAGGRQFQEDESNKARRSLDSIVTFAISACQGDIIRDIVDTIVLMSESRASTAGKAKLHMDRKSSSTSDASSIMKETSSANSTSSAIEQVALQVLANIPANLVTRAQREKLLDTIVGWGPVIPFNSGSSPRRRFALIIKLMELPVPNSRLCTDPKALQQLAREAEHDCSKDDESRLDDHWGEQEIIALYEELVRLVLKQLLANQNQERPRFMLKSLSSVAAREIQISLADPGAFQFRGLSVLAHVVVRELDDGAKEDLKEQLPHQAVFAMTEYFLTLYGHINLNTTELKTMVEDRSTSSGETKFAGLLHAARAIMNGSKNFLSCSEIDTATLIASIPDLVEILTKKANVSSRSQAKSTDELCQETLKLLMLARFVLVCNISPRGVTVRLIELAQVLLKLELGPVEHEHLLSAFEQSVIHSGAGKRPELISILLLETTDISSHALLLACICIKHLENNPLEKQDGPFGSLLLRRLIDIAITQSDMAVFKRSMDCINVLLRDKPSFINQHSIETIIINLPKLARLHFRPNIAYREVCNCLSLILLHHRARIQGRFHFVVRIFQQLLSLLFKNNKTVPSKGSRLNYATAQDARALSHLLILFCEPSKLRSRQRSDDATLALVDEARKEQAHVGRHAQYILHHYCVQVLNGILGEGMKEALTPGLWALIEAIQINDLEGIKVLNAGMNNNERAILRDNHAKWRKFGKWRG